MAGLMQSGPQAAAPAGPTAQQPGITDPDEQAANVTPEEQAAYDKFVGNAMEIMYPQGQQAQVAQTIVAQLSGEQSDEAAKMFAEAQPPLGNTPIDNLAATTTMIVVTLEDSAAQSGADIPDEVVMHAGQEILEQLADIAEAANIHDFQEEELEGAFYRATDLYRISSSRVDPESLSQEFGQVQQADQQGTLGQLLPGIEQRMQQGQPEQGEQEQD
tara:strand:+ start:4655 stop:5302 length:648 start_codon:yes stop_codon:yes gene_type:complete